MPAGDVGVGQPGRTGEGDAPSGGGGESQREGVDRTVPGMAHHLPNLRFSPRPWLGPPLPWGGHGALRLLRVLAG